MQTILVFYHLLALVKPAGFPGPAVPPSSNMCSSHSRGSYKLCLTSPSSMGYFISLPLLTTSSFFFFFYLATQGSLHCPQNFDTFQRDQKVSFLLNKQIRNLFSAQHSLSAFQVPLHTHSFGFFIAFSFTRMPNIPTDPKLSPQ